MRVYRLSPQRRDDPSWKYSIEKAHVWTCASTPDEARDIVAAKTGFAKLAEPGAVSPWKDERVTNCVEEPTMTYPDPGEVIREDGSPVSD
ncbi:hypothetical protein K9U39_05690 [Rhodoblastus acidophilus]|uniref:Uncharacterized protein n=1 Tax=Candidatus Rhodoblastus alkanivorans TaxID=2954117 RepID=A0ABS9Z678_9HYPH|nr:hypothetical protein [Candidatus Rhodoblastus alkanivorans]MCI4679138.1 hypothetical protein [Candidatus Rhodoblastus alkanivorans]MCI4683134.1 hypothetical protein [Candidatus Rhodoblastus alkanivorans]MDI4640445.1 hypothetical protein [Rhodoblastus acidophilus]